MLVYVFTFLLLNTIGALIYAVLHIGKNRSPFLALFFIFLPGLGFLMYGINVLVYHLYRNFSYDKESLVRRIKFEQLQVHPKIEQELNVVPVMDAMAISTLYEKRALVLDQLRKSINDNYKLILEAENDEDSESVHYVAAAKMEVYRQLQKRWEEVFHQYEKDKESVESVHQIFETIEEFVQSQVLSSREESLFRRRYCDLYETHRNQQMINFTQREQSTYLSYLIEGKDCEKAEQFFEQLKSTKQEEDYIMMLSMYYTRQDQEGFYQCMEELEKDKTIRLSSKGLEKLRYWRERK